MKISPLMLLALAMLPAGCAMPAKLLSTATGLVGSAVGLVTVPLSGLTRAADDSPEAGWKESIAALNRETDKTHDRRQPKAKRRN